MKRAIPGLLGVVALALIVGSPYAKSIDDAYVRLSLYVGLPLLLITSIYAVHVWWKTQINGHPPPTPFKTRWPRVASALEWLNWL